MTSTSLPAQILALVTLIAFSAPAAAQSDPLPSWNEGPGKQAIVAFVKSRAGS